MSSYLNDRVQQVRLLTQPVNNAQPRGKSAATGNAILSQKRNVNWGVPQGSILGPLIFLIFINDVFCCNICSKLDLFADDSQLYASAKPENIPQLINQLQEDFDKIAFWMKNNLMGINPKKSVVLVIRSPQVKQLLPELELSLDGQRLQLVTEAKDLGVILDTSLTYSAHISSLITKCRQKLTGIAKVTKLTPLEARKTLVESLVMSKLAYCTNEKLLLFQGCNLCKILQRK